MVLKVVEMSVAGLFEATAKWHKDTLLNVLLIVAYLITDETNWLLLNQ